MMMKCRIDFKLWDLCSKQYSMYVGRKSDVEEKFFDAIYNDIPNGMEEDDIEDLFYEAKIERVVFDCGKLHASYEDDDLKFFSIEDLFDFRAQWENVTYFSDDEIKKLWEKYGEVIFLYRDLEY